MARILVIDDENNIRMMLKIALTHVGNTVETAADGYEGLEKFANTGEGWDLVVLDQRMPGLEGLEVLREMRKRNPAARVLMITAFGTIDLATEAIAAGAIHFLRKPFTVETLRGAVGAALVGKSADKIVSLPDAFDAATVNGFRLAASGATTTKDGGMTRQFSVTTPTGTQSSCVVTLPPYLVELVKAHADRETFPGGAAFWQVLCAEALANYLWQNADVPAGGILLVEDLTSGLRHFVDAMLSGAQVPA